MADEEFVKVKKENKAFAWHLARTTSNVEIDLCDSPGSKRPRIGAAKEEQPDEYSQSAARLFGVVAVEDEAEEWAAHHKLRADASLPPQYSEQSKENDVGGGPSAVILDQEDMEARAAQPEGGTGPSEVNDSVAPAIPAVPTDMDDEGDVFGFGGGLASQFLG